MKLYIKQRIFSWTATFDVCDENGQELYKIKGKLFSIPKKLIVYDSHDEEVAYIKQKMITFLKPTYYVSVLGKEEMALVRQLTLFKPKYILGNKWEFKGDIWAHEYEFEMGSVTKKWFSWGDTYCLDMQTENKNEVLLALCCLIGIDAIEEDIQASNDANNN